MASLTVAEGQSKIGHNLDQNSLEGHHEDSTTIRG